VETRAIWLVIVPIDKRVLTGVITMVPVVLAASVEEMLLTVNMR
jgi:hypothetical protein